MENKKNNKQDQPTAQKPKAAVEPKPKAKPEAAVESKTAVAPKVAAAAKAALEAKLAAASKSAGAPKSTAPQSTATAKEAAPKPTASAEEAVPKSTAPQSTATAKEAASKKSDPPQQSQPEQLKELKLQALYAFKQGMTSVFDDKGRMVPVTVLKFEPQVVSQIKNSTKEGYSAVQLAFGTRKGRSKPKVHTAQLKKLRGFDKGARYVREVRQQQDVQDATIGQQLSIESLAAGDKVKITARSKGRGFAGTMKRWGFGGGPASHGAGFHRKPGSVGNCVEPGRVMPGIKMSGHFGSQQHTRARVEVVDVLKDQHALLVKGPVPGARNTLVYLEKQG